MTLEEFKLMLLRHDRYYQYSDDSRVYRKGREQLDAINRAKNELGEPAVEMMKQYLNGDLK